MKEILQSLLDSDFFTGMSLAIAAAFISSIILKYLNSSKEYTRLFKKQIDEIKDKQESLNDLKKRKSLENL